MAKSQSGINMKEKSIWKLWESRRATEELGEKELCPDEEDEIEGVETRSNNRDKEVAKVD